MEDLIRKCNRSILESQAALARSGEVRGVLYTFRSGKDFPDVTGRYQEWRELRPSYHYPAERNIPGRTKMVYKSLETTFEPPEIDRRWFPIGSIASSFPPRYCITDKPRMTPREVESKLLVTGNDDKPDEAITKDDNVTEQEKDEDGKIEEVDSIPLETTPNKDTVDDEAKVSEKDNTNDDTVGIDDDRRSKTDDNTVFHTTRRNKQLSYLLPRNRQYLVDSFVPVGLLHKAVINGDLALVQSLISEGANVNEIDINGFSALHHAVERSHYGILNLLLAKCSILVNITDDNGKTPLHYAARNGQTQIVLSLLKHAAYANCADRNKQSPLHLACQNGRFKTVEVLLEHGGSVYSFDNDMKAPLHYAVENNHTAVVAAMLRRGAPADQNDGLQNKPLHYVAQLGLFAMADALLTHGATVDCLDQNMKTPLLIAVENNTIALVKTFISYGASVDSADSERLTPLHIASLNGNIDIVKLLLQKGAKVDAPDCAKKTPLCYAVENNEAGVVQALLADGASTSIHDSDRKTPLCYAVEMDDELIIKILASHDLNQAKTDRVYWNLLDDAFKYENELIGDLVLTHAFGVYDEKVKQKSTTDKTKEGMNILIQSLLDAVCRQFSIVYNEKLLKVWTAYREQSDTRPVIIANVSSFPVLKPKEYMGIPVLYRLLNPVSEEAVLLGHMTDEMNIFADPVEMMAAQRAIYKNESKLSLEHSNLLYITVSPIRSTKKGTVLERETCIVLHCRFKGIIPFGEKCFPKEIDGFPVDVREAHYAGRGMRDRYVPWDIRRKQWDPRFAWDIQAREDMDSLMQNPTTTDLDFMDGRMRDLMM